MDIKDLLAPDDVMCDVRATDKERLLRTLSQRAATALHLDAALVADEIAKREELGSTGMGAGIAIPHARIGGLTRPFGLLARLAKPIAFAAIDGQAVDIVFLLLLPLSSGGEQLPALACVARRLRDAAVAERLRSAADSTEIYRAITT